MYFGGKRDKMWGKGKKFVLTMPGNPYKYVVFAYFMRRIGSAEVTGPIPVSSLVMDERKAFKMRVFRFFFASGNLVQFGTCRSTNQSPKNSLDFFEQQRQSEF